MYKIERGNPIPEGELRTTRGGRRRKYPLAELQPGENFSVPRAAAQAARRSVEKWAYRHPGWEYKTAWLDDGRLGIWRVA